MKEIKFSVVSENPRTKIIGGFIWKAPRQTHADESSVRLEGKKLSIAIRQDDTIEGIIKQLQKLTRKTSFGLYFKLIITYLMEPVLLVMPAAFMVLIIGLLGAYGNLINELLSLGNGATQVIIDKKQIFFVYTSFFILIAYLFPFIFQGDFVKTFSDAKKYLDTDQRHRNRAAKALKLLSVKSKFVDRVELWNPGLLKEGLRPIGKTLISGIVAADLPVDIYIHINEKFATRKFVEKLAQHPVQWKESTLEEDEAMRPIALEYLQNWEKELLPLMVCASTANVPDHWYVDANKNETIENTALINVLSLSLMELLVDHFGSRFFSNTISREKVSVEVFVNRCLNDYGFLSPVNELTSDMFTIQSSIVDERRLDVRAEMEYVRTWLRLNVAVVLKKSYDPAAAVILAGTHATTSIYNERKLLSIEGFIKAITHTEQYHLLRKYWRLISAMQTKTVTENIESKLFRLIRTQSLRDLVQAFQHAGMYEKTNICYDYLKAIYPIDSGIGESKVLSQQGKYVEAVEKLIEMDRQWINGKLSPEAENTSFNNPDPAPVTKINFYTTLAVIIVMNRVSQYKQTTKLSFEIMGEILTSMQDGERDSYQMARYYNVLASYYEWEGKFEKALETYDKGLKIPEVDESAVSNLLVNQGIAYRMIGKLQTNPKEAIRYLEKGIQCNEEGVHAKQIIGNEDQLPVALHNLAETYIELAYRLSAKEEKINTFQQAYQCSQLGLDINQRINSTKKQGQLLCERFLAIYWLNQLETPLPADKASVQKALLNWVEGRTDIEDYDSEVVLDLMLRTETFTGSSLKMLGKWLRKDLL